MSYFENSCKVASSEKKIGLNSSSVAFMDNSMKMLLVEDSTLLQEVLFETISKLKNVLITGTALSSQKATLLIDTNDFDILLLDIELVEGTGFDVIRHIKKFSYTFREPIIILLTNHTHPHYRTLAHTLGVNYFFDKSMDFDLVIEAIELEAYRFSSIKH